MGTLVKDIKTKIIPGSPGIPAFPGTPYIPGYMKTVTVTVVEGISQTVWYIDENVYSETYGEKIYFTITNTSIKETITVWVPPQPAVPGFPGLPPVPAQISTSLNEGWNSHSRSITPLALNEYVLFSIARGSRGLFIGTGAPGLEGTNISTYAHGLLIDTAGIKVFENGQIVKTLVTNYDSASTIRISRQQDNSIVYVATVGTNTYVYTSLASTVIKIAPLFVYTYMYLGGDKLLDPSIGVGEVQYGVV